VGSRVGLHAVEKRKIFCTCRESNPGRPAGSPVPIPIELSRLPELERRKENNLWRRRQEPYKTRDSNYSTSSTCEVIIKRRFVPKARLEFPTYSPLYTIRMECHDPGYSAQFPNALSVILHSLFAFVVIYR
jgi:hypothetical protein